MKVRICKQCNCEDLLDNFPINKPSKDGRLLICKSCKSLNDKKYYELKKENIINKVKEYSKLNPHVGIAARKKYKKNNPGLHQEWRARKYAGNACPNWLTDIQFMQIDWFYKAAKMMTDTTGIKHVVDHIHPLRGNGFNGLHVPWNLQCITEKANQHKGNRIKEP